MTTGDTGSPRGGSPLDLDPETMRKVGYQVVDRIVQHLTEMDTEPAWDFLTREEGERRLREPVPEKGTPLEELIPVLYRDVLAYAGRIGHPRFFAFVPSAVTFAGVMGDFIAAAHNPFVGTWLGGSGPSMLELVVMDWIRDMLGLPPGSGGLLTSGGSAATVMAMVVARQATGVATEDAIIYTSDQTHVCVPRAAWIAGFPKPAVRTLPTGDRYRLDPDHLARTVESDRKSGKHPFMVVANAGATNTGDVDPLPELGELAARESLWFHVDAAYGGFARITKRGRKALAGMETADSWVLDPHKWLFQGYECGSLLVKNPDLLRETFQIFPEYMQDVRLGEEQPNFGDRGIQLTRTSRAFKIWLSLKNLGLDAFRKAVDRSLDLALLAEQRIRNDPGFELLSPARLGVVCFRIAADGVPEGDLESRNREVLTRLNQSGYAFLSSTRLQGKFSLRLCILSHRTTEADVHGVLDRLRELGDIG